MFNTLRPRRDRRHFADDIFKWIFFNENGCILMKFSLKYVRKGPIDNNRALVQIMAWRRSGDKPLSEPMMISLQTHICVTGPQWVNSLASEKFDWNFKEVIIKLILVLGGLGISCEIALRWMSLKLTQVKLSQVNIASGNGLVPSGHKPLPEPMLTEIYVAIRVGVKRI